MNGLKYINLSLDIICCIVCFVILFFIMASGYGKDKRSRFFACAVIVNILLLLTDFVDYILVGSPDPRAHLPLTVTAGLTAAYGPILLALLTGLIMAVIEGRTEVSRTAACAAYAAVATCAADIICVIATQFNHMYFLVDENNLIVRQDWFLLSQFFSFVCMALNAGIIIAHRKFLNRRELVILLSYEVIPSAAVLVHILVGGFSIINFAVTLAILLYFAGIQMELLTQIKQKELELTESRISVMLSQIQPHFLYNSLTAIAQLCDEDPEKAKKTTIDFSGYLRSNMDSLGDKGLIAFEKELEHVKNYLNLEKAVYGDALEVSYRIDATGFPLPPLTVQPIVENAVKHGAGKREGGGTITVSSRETDKEYLVIISDDGMGYDMDKPRDGRQSHIGIENVRKRLSEQCGGSLELVSEPGRGTTATIKIPKGVSAQ